MAESKILGFWVRSQLVGCYRDSGTGGEARDGDVAVPARNITIEPSAVLSHIVLADVTGAVCVNLF